MRSGIFMLPDDWVYILIYFGLGLGQWFSKKVFWKFHILPLNGLVNYPDDEWKALSFPQQSWIAAAGPLVNVIIGIATVEWLPLFGLLSLVIGVVNFIPFKTKNGLSDGGYVFRHFTRVPRMVVSLMVFIFIGVVYF